MIAKNIQSTKRLAKKIAPQVKNGGLVLLYGTLGSGKTTFVKGLAEGLGIKEFSIKSPTYTYIRHHPLKKNNFYHLDLYRLETVDNLLLQQIKELLENKKNILIVEWADRLPGELFKEALKITFSYLDATSREINFTGLIKQSLSKEEIYSIYQEFKVPPHIIRHMKKVAQVCKIISALLIKKGFTIDQDCLIKAALLHDTLRVCDIRAFNPSKFSKKPTSSSIKLWLNLRKKYSKIGHEKAMAHYLIKRGYPEIADIIGSHGFFEVYNLKTLPQKILYYADKRVDKDKIVSLKKRLTEGKKRNFRPTDDLKFIIQTQQKVFDLEAEFKKLLGKHLKNSQMQGR